jgi:undecaprenyl-phosphate 4-deoxy-4-formamido-L-arabinose transferase
MNAGVSVVVPVYNSEQTLEVLVQRLEPVLRASTGTFELVLVNDGSSDGSWDTIRALAGRHQWIKGLNLMRNYGQHAALLCGVRAAGQEIIVTMDDDLQNPPEEVPKLLAELARGHDVVYGVPHAEQHGFWRDLASQVTKFALKSALGASTARHASAFRAFRTELREAFSGYHGSFVSIDVLLTWGTRRFSSVPVEHDPRRVGQSQYTLRKLILHALNLMTGFSTVPLQMASLVGFAFTAFGVLLLAFVVLRFLIQGTSVPGFTFLASVIVIFSGAQLFALGIIGEYLARMHFRMMDRPPYVVREVIGAL